MEYKRIKDLRKDNDLTQVYIAKFLGCHDGVYRKYELEFGK